MRHSTALILLAVSLGQWSPAYGRTQVYQPLGRWTDPDNAAYRRWDASRQTQAVRTLNPDSRPKLAGLRSQDVELLEDAFLRKHPKLLKGSSTLARKLILRAFLTQNGLNRINGALAEAMFLYKNPEWGYVGKPNASQYDVYHWVSGRPTPVNGQVKFYENFSASRYADAMQMDFRAHRFFVPDDHVDPLKQYLNEKADEMARMGNDAEASRLRRDYARVRPLGAATNEIIAQRQKIRRELTVEENATYVSLGASIALALGPTTWDWATGNISGDIGLYRATRTLSLLGVAVGTDTLLMTFQQGTLRGTLKANVLVGAALTITEGLWLLHEHGWRRAFYEPSFYEEMGGGVSAIGLGLAGGAAAGTLSIEMTPWVAVPVGIGTGIVTGVIGYMGGRVATHKMLEIFAPEMLRQRERQQLASVQSRLDLTMANLQVWPPK